MSKSGKCEISLGKENRTNELKGMKLRSVVKIKKFWAADNQQLPTKSQKPLNKPYWYPIQLGVWEGTVSPPLGSWQSPDGEPGSQIMEPLNTSGSSTLTQIVLCLRKSRLLLLFGAISYVEKICVFSLNRKISQYLNVNSYSSYFSPSKANLFPYKQLSYVLVCSPTTWKQSKPWSCC